MDKQHWHAALACSVGLQCWDAEWTCMIDEQHATVAFTSSMGVQHRHSGWTWSMSVASYHVVRLACMSILHAVLLYMSMLHFDGGKFFSPKTGNLLSLR
jgi:hypothetical protein